MTFRMPSWPDHEVCTVEVLLVRGCAGAELALARVREAQTALAVETNLRIRIVEDDEDARALAFLGSPSVRVDGRDVEDAAVAGLLPVALAARSYEHAGVIERAPPVAWIQHAITLSARRA